MKRKSAAITSCCAPVRANAGGGRKRLSDTDATLAQALLRLVEPATLGDPIRPLLWVSKSVGVRCYVFW